MQQTEPLWIQKTNILCTQIIINLPPCWKRKIIEGEKEKTQWTLQKKIKLSRKMQINLHTPASSVVEGWTGTNKTTAQIGKNREARIDTCQKYRHLTDKSSRSKRWEKKKNLTYFWLFVGVTRHLNLLLDWLHKVLMGGLGGKVKWRSYIGGSPVGFTWLPQSVLDWWIC